MVLDIIQPALINLTILVISILVAIMHFPLEHKLPLVIVKS